VREVLARDEVPCWSGSQYCKAAFKCGVPGRILKAELKRIAFGPMVPSNPEALSMASRKIQKWCFGYVHNPSQKWPSSLTLLSLAQLTDFEHVDVGRCTNSSETPMVVFQVSQWSASPCPRRTFSVSAQRLHEQGAQTLLVSLGDSERLIGSGRGMCV
jgi:hypothetical protein